MSSNHRDLHPFPTRRSSDLPWPTLAPMARSSWKPKRVSRSDGGTTPAREPPIMSPFKAPPRSEEHTSELQSQSNLVCRLLLEKKKSTIIGFLTMLENDGVAF